jgi:hypothetical protein
MCGSQSAGELSEEVVQRTRGTAEDGAESQAVAAVEPVGGVVGEHCEQAVPQGRIGQALQGDGGVAVSSKVPLTRSSVVKAIAAVSATSR